MTKIETTESKIKSEKTGDLVNIHNFLASIALSDGNKTVFSLWIELQAELHNRPEAKKYLKAMENLFANR